MDAKSVKSVGIMWGSLLGERLSRNSLRRAAKPSERFEGWGVVSRSLSLVSHDVEHHVVGGAHSLFTYACEVVYALVDINVDNALGLRDMLPLHAQEC